MRALTWHGKADIRCESVPDPKIEHPRDAIIKVTGCAICGSDLHIYDGMIPSMERGDVLGHETMGEVVDVGRENTKLKKGDRVVVPFTISCGECFFCKKGFFSGCERSNPNAEQAAKLWGHSPAGLFGYSHLLGGFPGGQAEYLQMPVCRCRPDQGAGRSQAMNRCCSLVRHLSRPATWRAEFCDIKAGDTIAIWGCGPVGKITIRSAFLLGAERVIAVDTVPGASRAGLSGRRPDHRFPRKEDIYERIQELTHGRGADACVDAVGTEAHAAASFDSRLDRVKVATYLGTDRPHVLRQAIHNTRNFGVVSIIGVYGGLLDKIPMGSAINRGLTFRMAQTPAMPALPAEADEIDRGRKDRSILRHHTQGGTGTGSGDVPDFSRQAGRLHQGDDAPVRLRRRLILMADTKDSQVDFAIVTGASTGIGYELARECIDHGYDVLIAADEPEIQRAAESLRRGSAMVEAVQADLVDEAGVEMLLATRRAWSQGWTRCWPMRAVVLG